MTLRTPTRSSLILLIALAAHGQMLAEEPQSVPTPKPALKIVHEKRPVPIEGEVRDGWQQAITLPDTLLSTGDRLVLSVKDGWLRARHESSNGQWDWQLVLCQVVDEIVPVVRVRDGLPFVEVSYLDGRFFVRQSQDLLRILRQEGAPPDALIPNAEVRSENAKSRGSGHSGVVNIVTNSWQDADWFVIAHGPSDEAWHTVVRLNPMEYSKSGYGVSLFGAGHLYHFHGERWLVDDGELLVALLTRPAIYETQKKRESFRKAILAGGKLPDIDAASWLNTTDKPTWESLRGKVVLLDFWATWCQPCVKKLPAVQALHDKFGDRGFVALGIHSQQGGETCAEYVSENGYTFPTAVDSGKTEEEFAIEGWPTYFLIDRSGKVVEGFTHDLPTDETIDELLGQSSAP